MIFRARVRPGETQEIRIIGRCVDVSVVGVGSPATYIRRKKKKYESADDSYNIAGAGVVPRTHALSDSKKHLVISGVYVSIS